LVWKRKGQSAVGGFFGIFPKFREAQREFRETAASVLIKALHKMLTTIIDGGFLSGVSLGSRNTGAVHICHVLFVDDTGIFWKVITSIICMPNSCALKPYIRFENYYGKVVVCSNGKC
jgi:hypothetical protein